MNNLVAFGLGLVAYQAAITAHDWHERLAVHRVARQVADAQGKPLLNIGCPRTYLQSYPCGDYCLDIDPARLRSCEGKPLLSDVRKIEAPDNYFGAATCFHVLEHMPTVADAEQAIEELARVSAFVFVLSPRRNNLLAWTHPDHSLWVGVRPDGSVSLEQRRRGESNGEAMYGVYSRGWNWAERLIETIRTGGSGANFERHASAVFGSN